MPRKLVIIALAAASAALALYVWPVQTLTIRLPREGNMLVRAVTVDHQDFILLKYRHSVEGSRVEGTFKPGPGLTLLATETRMDSVGTGLPNTAVNRSRREGEWIVVNEGNKPLPNLRFFLSPINRTRLFVNHEEIPLKGLAPGSLLVISLENTNLTDWLLWRITGLAWTGKGGRE